jgi:hypothetical protein
VTDWLPGCCHPTSGPHGPGEPLTCCHVHVEDLPSNKDGQQGEPLVPPKAWTAQEQALVDKITTLEATAPKKRAQPWSERHEHKL